MSDPRLSANPTSNRVRNCATVHESQIGTSIDRKNSWAGGLGKLGNLGIWSKSGNTGLNNVGVGLRDIAKISNSVRSGNGNLPSVVGSSADWVLSKLGMNSPSADILKNLNPDVFNRAYGQAENIYDLVTQGKFSINSIPDVFQDMQDMEQLLRGIFTDKPGRTSKMTDHCGASPYAMDLIAFAPKYKFLFVVEFEFESSYNGMDQNQIAFVVKSSSRPEIDFEYEDINYYNFRSKAIKKTNYHPINMKFLDDDMNQAMQFYTTYLKLMSPIANMNFKHKISDQGFYDASAMEFGARDKANITDTITGSPYSASVGPLKNEAATILRQINLYHVYKQGRLMNVYKFFNPRILNMQLDEVSMDGDVNEVGLQFAYDGLFIVPGYDAQRPLTPDSSSDYRVNGLSSAFGSANRTNGLEYNGQGTPGITDLNAPPGAWIDDNINALGAKEFTDPMFGGIKAKSNSDFFKTDDIFKSVKLPESLGALKDASKITPNSINETSKIANSTKSVVGNPDDKLTDKQFTELHANRNYFTNDKTGKINRGMYTESTVYDVKGTRSDQDAFLKKFGTKEEIAEFNVKHGPGSGVLNLPANLGGYVSNLFEG